MELKIDQYLITSDRFQYTLYEDRIKKKKDEDDDIDEEKEPGKAFIGYFIGIEHLLLKLLSRNIDNSLAVDIKGLIEDIHGVKLYIRKASNAIIDVLHSLPKEVQESLPKESLKELDQLVKEQERVLQSKPPKQVASKQVALKKTRGKKVSKIMTKKGKEIL